MIKNLQQLLNPLARDNKTRAEGSQTFEFETAGILIGAVETVRVGLDQWRNARKYLPLDEITFINNSAEAIRVWLNSPTETRIIPAYTIKGIANQAFVQFTIENYGTGNIAAGEVIVQAKRIGEKVTFVKSV